jgi:hypothetical protein
VLWQHPVRKSDLDFTQFRPDLASSRTYAPGSVVGSHPKKERRLEEQLEDTIRADVQRYKDMLNIYRSKQTETAHRERGFYENTKETERHLENVIRELEALLRDRKEGKPAVATGLLRPQD